MGREDKRKAGMEEAHPFMGMSQVNPKAAGVDIGAVEIVVCVVNRCDKRGLTQFM